MLAPRVPFGRPLKRILVAAAALIVLWPAAALAAPNLTLSRAVPDGPVLFGTDSRV